MIEVTRRGGVGGAADRMPGRAGAPDGAGFAARVGAAVRGAVVARGAAPRSARGAAGADGVAASAPPFAGVRPAGTTAGRGAAAAGNPAGGGISAEPSGISRMPASARPYRARRVTSSPIGLTMQISPALARPSTRDMMYSSAGLIGTFW